MVSKLSWSVVLLPVLTALLLMSPSSAVGGPPTHTDCTVTGISGQCLAANNGRSYLSLQNKSDTAIYCTTDGNTATVLGGYWIDPRAIAWWDVEPTVPKVAINCIYNGAGTKTLTLTEQTQ